MNSIIPDPVNVSVSIDAPTKDFLFELVILAGGMLCIGIAVFFIFKKV